MPAKPHNKKTCSICQKGEMKYCPGCKNHFPLSSFGKNRSKPDGLQRECRDCVTTRRKGVEFGRDPTIGQKTKYCPGCRKTKDVRFFSKHKHRKDGLHPYCKTCRAAQRKRTEENKKRAQAAKEKAQAAVSAAYQQFLSSRLPDEEPVREPLPQGNPPVDEKHCARCQSLKPAREFYRNANNPDGLSENCKACSSLAYRFANR